MNLPETHSVESKGKPVANWVSYIGVSLALCSISYTFAISSSVRRTNALREEIVALSNSGVIAIKDAEQQSSSKIKDSATEQIQGIAKSFAAKADELSSKSLESYREQFKTLQGELATARQALEQAKDDLSRLHNGLPSRVSLDQVNEHYIALQAGTSAFSGETFSTGLGRIWFAPSDFEFQYYQSKLVRLKIGKKRWDGSFELSEAWLNDSLKSKLANGYRVVENETKTTTYGKAEWKVLRFDDLYCRIYKESTRYKGDTYNTTHVYYTFFVEIGSMLGTEAIRALEYNSKLGS